MRIARLLATASCILLPASLALGSGIEVPMQSARAAGQADAFTAQADDASAIFYNPAGLTQIQGTQISVGALGLFPEFRFEANAGPDEAMRLPTLIPHVYVASDLGLDRWRFGIGVNDTYGINTDWGDKGPLRVLVDKAKLATFDIAPTAAYQLTDSLSVGVALNVIYGQLDLQRNVTLGPPPTPEGEFHLKGSDWAIGVTPSLLWKINEQNSIGAYYRSPYTLHFSGDAHLTGPGFQFGPTNAKENLTFPQSAGIGYAIRPVKPLKLEADAIWTDWHVVDQFRIHSQDPHFNNQAIPLDWKSGWTLRGGVQYDLTRHWTLRGGYAWSQNASPDSTFTPLVPDSNYHLFAAGIGYSTDNWAIDFAYEYIYRETRHIDGGNIYSPLLDGTWHNTMNGFMLTFTAKL